MNNIILLLGNNIGSIIFQYLTISKDECEKNKYEINSQLKFFFDDPHYDKYFNFDLKLYREYQIVNLISNRKIEKTISKIRRNNIIDQTLYFN